MTFRHQNIIIKLQSRETETSIQRNSKGKREGGKHIAYVKKTDNPRMGRPKTNRVAKFTLRLTEGENNLLEEIANRTGRTKTEIVARGIALVYKEINK